MRYPYANLVVEGVSMESGLEDRNNQRLARKETACDTYGLNGVRPRRPEQSISGRHDQPRKKPVSLNGVRPRRPEQWFFTQTDEGRALWVSMESGLEDRNNPK